MKDNRPNQPKQTTSPKPRCSLHATGIHAGYKDGEDILAGVDLHARAGEVTTLIGPNGCGKSTLLRAVGGFLKPSSGEIRMDGRPIGAPGPERMTVFQEFDQLLPWRTVLEIGRAHV